MKKLLLAVIALFFMGTVFSQQTAVKLTRQEAAKLHVSVPLHQTPSATPQNYVPQNLRGNTLPYFTIGQTRYDLQTNGSMAQRLIMFDDGTSAATWTTCGTSSSSRGSGYNYYNGTSWTQGSGSSAPINRIESVKTGWPTIAPIGDNGEIVISHNGSTGLVINVRPNKGTGNWSETVLQGPSIYDSYIGGNSTALLWPSVATNGNTIHLIACTESDTVSLYQGIQTCLLYYRGTYNPSDNTIVWENPRIVADMANHLDWFNGFGGDSYVIVANGNTVAVVYAEPWTDAFMWKSTDNGENWTTTTIVNSVVPDIFDEGIHLVDTIGGPAYVTDGSFAAAIDDNGKVHVAFGLTGVSNPDVGDGGIFVYPGIDGLFYWNESMPALLAQTKNQLNPDSLEANGYTVFSKVDLNGDDDLYGLSNANSDTYSFTDYHRTGVTSMPSLAVDGNNVYLIWASCLEYPFIGVNATNTPAYYRGIFGAKSINGGTSFEDGISWLSYNKSCYYVDWDLYDWDPDASEWNDGSIEMEGENVYPSIAQNIVNGKLNIIWHSDYFPGNAQGSVSQNDPTLVLFTSIDADQLGVYNNIEEIPQGLWIDTWTGIADNTLSGMQLYPNPASDVVNVIFSSEETANAQLTIHNLMGQQVYSESIAIQEGSNVVRINTSNFQAGVYMVNIKSNQGTTTQKLIVR